MKILFTGGGTAGHIFPIIAIVRKIKKEYQEKDIQFFYFGPEDDFSKDLLSQEGIKVRNVLSGKIRRYFGLKAFFQNIGDIFKIPVGFLQAFFHIFIISPDAIFSKGGFGSIPTVLAGWLLMVPIFLHESDVVPGFANKFLSRFSLQIFISFPIEHPSNKMKTFFPHKKIISVGNPIRLELLTKEKKAEVNLLKLTGEKPIVLILGGSQGAQRINEVILAVLPELLLNFELIHQVGPKNFKEIEAEVKAVIDKELQKYYHLFSFLNEEEIKQAYAAADLIVSRAGSGAIFEIAAIGKPAILIPLPEAAQNHQLKNAYTYAENNAALVIEETNFKPHFFLERIKYLISQPEKLKKMAHSAEDFSRPQAARIIAGYIVEYLLQKPK